MITHSSAAPLYKMLPMFAIREVCFCILQQGWEIALFLVVGSLNTKAIMILVPFCLKALKLGFVIKTHFRPL